MNNIADFLTIILYFASSYFLSILLSSMWAEDFNTLRTVIPFEPSDHLSEYSLFDSSLFDPSPYL